MTNLNAYQMHPEFVVCLFPVEVDEDEQRQVERRQHASSAQVCMCVFVSRYVCTAYTRIHVHVFICVSRQRRTRENAPSAQQANHS